MKKSIFVVHMPSFVCTYHAYELFKNTATNTVKDHQLLEEIAILYYTPLVIYVYGYEQQYLVGIISITSYQF